jgi:hypothetical protein
MLRYRVSDNYGAGDNPEELHVYDGDFVLVPVESNMDGAWVYAAMEGNPSIQGWVPSALLQAVESNSVGVNEGGNLLEVNSLPMYSDPTLPTSRVNSLMYWPKKKALGRLLWEGQLPPRKTAKKKKAQPPPCCLLQLSSPKGAKLPANFPLPPDYSSPAWSKWLVADGADCMQAVGMGDSEEGMREVLWMGEDIAYAIREAHHEDHGGDGAPQVQTKKKVQTKKVKQERLQWKRGIAILSGAAEGESDRLLLFESVQAVRAGRWTLAWNMRGCQWENPPPIEPALTKDRLFALAWQLTLRSSTATSNGNGNGNGQRLLLAFNSKALAPDWRTSWEMAITAACGRGDHDNDEGLEARITATPPSSTPPPSNPPSLSPEPLPSSAAVAAFTAGPVPHHTVACAQWQPLVLRGTDGAVLTWGCASTPLGTGHQSWHAALPRLLYFPMKMMSSPIRIRQVCCGRAFGMALDEEGDVYYWGEGYQINSPPHFTPTLQATPHPCQRIAAWGSSACRQWEGGQWEISLREDRGRYRLVGENTPYEQMDLHVMVVHPAAEMTLILTWHSQHHHHHSNNNNNNSNRSSRHSSDDGSEIMLLWQQPEDHLPWDNPLQWKGPPSAYPSQAQIATTTDYWWWNDRADGGGGGGGGGGRGRGGTVMWRRSLQPPLTLRQPTESAEAADWQALELEEEEEKGEEEKGGGRGYHLVTSPTLAVVAPLHGQGYLYLWGDTRPWEQWLGAQSIVRGVSPIRLPLPSSSPIISLSCGQGMLFCLLKDGTFLSAGTGLLGQVTPTGSPMHIGSAPMVIDSVTHWLAGEDNAV